MFESLLNNSLEIATSTANLANRVLRHRTESVASDVDDLDGPAVDVRAMALRLVHEAESHAGKHVSAMTELEADRYVLQVSALVLNRSLAEERWSHDEGAELLASWRSQSPVRFDTLQSPERSSSHEFEPTGEARELSIVINMVWERRLRQVITASRNARYKSILDSAEKAQILVRELGEPEYAAELGSARRARLRFLETGYYAPPYDDLGSWNGKNERSSVVSQPEHKRRRADKHMNIALTNVGE